MAKRKKKGGRRAARSWSILGLIPVVKVGSDVVFGRADLGWPGAIQQLQSGDVKGALLDSVNKLSMEATGIHPRLGQSQHPIAFFPKPLIENIGLIVVGKVGRRVAPKLGLNKALKATGLPLRM